MLDQATVEIVQNTAIELRRRGEDERAAALEAVLLAAQATAVGVDNGAIADLVGVDGQTLQRWVVEGRHTAYRAGLLAVPSEVVEEYVRRARTSLDLDPVSDGEAAHLVAESRRRE